MPGSAVLLCPLVDLTGAHVQDRAPDDAARHTVSIVDTRKEAAARSR